MKILKTSVVTAASTKGPRDGILRDDVPQFAFIGRSNVGKSSLLNALLRQKLARTSAAAGKTRQAVIFAVTVEGGTAASAPWTIHLIDLPGYGYARGGHDSVAELATTVEAYFAAVDRQHQAPQAAGAAGRQSSGAVFLLVDSRHPGLRSDIDAYRRISERTTPQIVATKIDKLTRAERTRNLRAFEDVFGAPPVAASATSGEGLDALWRLITEVSRRVMI
jgi:GTP-binding protein